MRRARCLVALSGFWLLCWACQGRDDLLPGETLEGVILHTWIQVPCESKQRAEAIGAREGAGEALQAGETWLYRAPRTVDLQKDILGQETLPKVARVEDGFYRTIKTESFQTMQEAEDAVAGRGIEMFHRDYGKGLAIRGIRGYTHTTKDGRTLTSYHVDADWEQDLVAEAREMLWKEAQVIKYALKDVGEWKYRRATAAQELPTGERSRLLKFGHRVMAEYCHPRSGAVAIVGWLREPKPFEHELVSEVMGQPKRDVIKCKGGYAAMGDDGKRQVFVWQAATGELVKVRVVIGGGKASDLVDAYMQWLPSVWPTKDTELDRMAWIRAEVDLLIDEAAQWIEPQGKEPYRDCWIDRFVYGMELVDQWFDTPLRCQAIYHMRQQYGTVEARAALHAQIKAWWAQNRGKAKLRPGAPVELLELVAIEESGANSSRRGNCFLSGSQP